MSEQDQQDQPVDERANAESRVAEQEASQTRQGASSGGPVPADYPAAGRTPAEQDEAEDVPGGTAAGSPLAGVRISDEDAADAVSGDQGPEHPGRRSQSPTTD
ncbi:hypothetical protein [Arsenicicoccus sp. oral taxon 190]|uniref:hypothetical protein n=1 Tax=Arsenicicoccus sp. oral taxon 190 TaxID=1658671 RepID=UPI00067A008F|nr:hypothetical protein [Arsenicicoccus sp. oral taxon 190]AKT51840.1 hypothetical protein ADJ73_12165 [Arsenicicoccus sp. oral taxon 190]